MTVSTVLADFILKAVVLGTPFSFDQLWLGAFIAVPSDGDPVGAEVSGSGYQRALVSFGQPNNKYVQAGPVTFPLSTGPWGTISYLGLCDTATALTGTVLVSGAVSGTPPSVLTNQILQVNIVRLSIV